MKKKLVLHACGTGGAVALLCYVLYVNHVPPRVWIKFTVAAAGVFTIIVQEWSEVQATHEPEDLDGLLIVLAEILGVLIGLAIAMLTFWQ